MSTFREQRRADRVAEAEQRRADEAARAEQRRADEQAQAERDRQAEKDRRAERRRIERDREAARDRARQRRQAARARLSSFVSAHVVELLIYPIALVSFALAAPAMASYGTEVYGGDTGVSWLGAGLPLITELGMWCFALAVQITRSRTPEAAVGRLQSGVWVFGSVAFTLNLVHGVDARWDHGVVMGIVAVAGVIAHQLAVAAPARSRAERAEARIARQAERKRAAARRAAVRQATARIDAAGRAELMFDTGTYRLQRRRLQPVTDPDAPGPVDAMDQALAALIDTETTDSDQDDQDEAGGGVATLDPPRDTPGPSNRPAKTTRRGGKPSRPLEDVRAEYQERIQADPRAAQWSARKIARELACGKEAAARLRDEQQGGDR